MTIRATVGRAAVVVAAGVIASIALTGPASANPPNRPVSTVPASGVVPASLPAGSEFIQNFHSGLCLVISGGSQSVGSKVAQATCDLSGNNHSEAWTSQPIADDSGEAFVNFHSGLCLAISGASQSAGAAAVQANCDFSGRNHAESWTIG